MFVKKRSAAIDRDEQRELAVEAAVQKTERYYRKILQEMAAEITALRILLDERNKKSEAGNSKSSNS